jgi:hypothetical protein
MECDNLSIILTFIGIVVPLIISEILPFSKCPSNGVLHFLHEKLKVVNNK